MLTWRSMTGCLATFRQGSAEDWLSNCVWPTEPDVTLGANGVSWLGLGVSFSMFQGELLPIISNDETGVEFLLVTKNAEDATMHDVTSCDMPRVFQSMFGQLVRWLGENKLPPFQRGLTNSMYVLGFQPCTSGILPRIAFYRQHMAT